MFNPLQFYEFGKSRGVAAFVSTWKTDNTSTGSSANNQISLPLVSNGNYDFVVKWGDGTQDTITTWNQAQKTHTYASIGTYQIEINGIITGWSFNATLDRLKIMSVQSWGVLRLVSSTGCFFACANLDLSAVTDLLDLTQTNTLNSCFRSCTALTTINRINEWNTSSIATAVSAFESATSFNQDLNNWDTSNMSQINSLFRNASSYNYSLSNWNTENVTTLSSTFSGANAFDQNIGNWKVSVVNNFSNVMLGKTAATFSAANLDAIYNGWSSRLVLAIKSINFSTAKRTNASAEGRALLSRAYTTKTITNAVNNGSGLIRITAIGHGLVTGNKAYVSITQGTIEAKGGWLVTVIDANTLDLQGTTFTNAFTINGELTTGWGWTITDGGI
jgi:surface protein